MGSGGNEGTSFINIALGEWSAEEGITGARRGGSIVLGPNEQTYSFSGDIASLAGPDGSGTGHHFMGTNNPNIVIGFDSTGTRNIGRDNPLNPTEDDTIENQSGATYHVGIGERRDDVETTQSTATLHGFAAGLAQHPGSNSTDVVGNFSANDVTISLDALTNTMTATLKVGEVDLSATAVLAALLKGDPNQLLNPKYNLAFGGDDRSAFIDDNTFAAIEAEDGSSVSGRNTLFRRGPFGIPIPQVKPFTDDDPDVQSYLVSSEAIQANSVLFGVNSETGEPNRQAFCSDCSFMRWGAWGTRVGYTDNTGPQTTDVQLGWWIAGDITKKDQMPLNGSARYAGDAIGNVNNNGNQYVATGNMDMSWNFNNRSGLLTISDFDDRTFSGTMSAPGQVQFSGPLAGGGVAGAASGAFVGNGADAARGVTGNFGVAGQNYEAAGIFGGRQTSFPPSAP